MAIDLQKLGQKFNALFNDPNFVTDFEQWLEAHRSSQHDAKQMLSAVFSQDYLEWVKQANLPPLTNTQHKFAEWLLVDENAKVIAQIGDLDTIFISVRRWLKNGS